jgi:hypothetical protein
MRPKKRAARIKRAAQSNRATRTTTIKLSKYTMPKMVVGVRIHAGMDDEKTTDAQVSGAQTRV